jgi:hypothetical protein
VALCHVFRASRLVFSHRRCAKGILAQSSGTPVTCPTALLAISVDTKEEGISRRFQERWPRVPSTGSSRESAGARFRRQASGEDDSLRSLRFGYDEG